MNAPVLRIVEPIAEPQRDIGSQGLAVRIQDIRLRHRLLSNLPPFLYVMVQKVTLYYHKDCYGCMKLKPILKKVARSKGWKYSARNIEKCNTKLCDSIEYVPTLIVDGKRLNENDLEAFLEREL